MKLITPRIAASLDNARLYALSQTQLEELRGLYDRIKSLEQLKTDMIRLAAHDIRNPVNTIMGFMFLLEDSPNMDADEKSYLEAVVRAAQNIQQITEDILSLQRIEQMHNEGTYETLNLSDLIRRSYDKNQQQANEKQQTYVLTVPETDVITWGDGAQIYEAVDNLIGNAIKYTPPEGKVTVNLWQEDSLIIFEVTDTGYGIPEEMQERLFQPFYRAKTAETSTIKGTG
ncbi:MAG: HAMP domain-containing histidine kinase, partial [Anaerolineae bacterium]|nr:HAMP domain-containing histidine kinase [Anaerolineae bacterium]